MKKLITTLALVAGLSTAAQAGQLANVWHVETVNRTVTEYGSERRCTNQHVPIYGNTVVQGSNNGDLLGAMILGGIFGKAIGDSDKAAAAGAVLGALTQNQNGTRTQRVITGYENRLVCNNISVPRQVNKKMYIIHWKRGHQRGSFYSDQAYSVGSGIYVN